MSDSAIGLIGIFLAIGGQYALLFQINRQIGALQMEFASCPYHRAGKNPAGDE